MATLDREEYVSDVQIAAMLGYHPVTVRKWRKKNTDAGCIKYGPPYEYRGPKVVYPMSGFRTWCSQVRIVNGVPRVNLPISATIDLPQQSSVNTEIADAA